MGHALYCFLPFLSARVEVRFFWVQSPRFFHYWRWRCWRVVVLFLRPPSEHMRRPEPSKAPTRALSPHVSTQLCNETCLGTAPLTLLMIWTSCSCHFLLDKLRRWRRVTASNYPGRRGKNLLEGSMRDCWSLIHQMFFFNGCFIDEKLKWQASSSPNNTGMDQQLLVCHCCPRTWMQSTNADRIKMDWMGVCCMWNHNRYKFLYQLVVWMM